MQIEEPATEIDHQREWTSRVENLRNEIVQTEEALQQLLQDPQSRQLTIHTWNLRLIFEDLMEYLNDISVDD